MKDTVITTQKSEDGHPAQCAGRAGRVVHLHQPACLCPAEFGDARQPLDKSNPCDFFSDHHAYAGMVDQGLHPNSSNRHSNCCR